MWALSWATFSGLHFLALSKRLIGRPKTRWEGDVLEDLKSMNVHSWKKVAQNRDSWKKVVEQARTLYRL